MLNGNRVVAIRARVRRGWSIKKIVRVFGVSRNAVRRHMRSDPTPRAPSTPAADEGNWELDLARRIARRQRTPDRDELEFELTSHLVTIYPRKQTARNWRTFLTTSLYNKAKTWLATRGREQRQATSLDAPLGTDGHVVATFHDVLASADVTPDDRLMLEAIWKKLDARDRNVLSALVAENFNVTEAAIRLGVHRNTVHNALRRIQGIAKAMTASTPGD